MKIPALPCAGIAALAGVVLSSASAHAIPRTFVSGSGSGAACTRAAPCATFQAAHDVTDAGGEVNCVDAGEYGAVTITKSVTIDCTGTIGAITVPSSTTTQAIGVDINTTGAIVRLRSLTIRGSGGSDFGVAFRAGAALYVEDCIVTGMTRATTGIGIWFRPSAAAKLLVANSTLSNNSVGIQVSASSADQVAMINGVVLENNLDGLQASGSGGSVSAHLRDSIASGNQDDGVIAFGSSTAVGSIVIDRSVLTLNGDVGARTVGSLAFVTIGRSTAASNGVGLFTGPNGGQIRTYHNNHLSGNVGLDGDCLPTPCAAPPPTTTLTLK
jgi:hypothetical protein